MDVEVGGERVLVASEVGDADRPQAAIAAKIIKYETPASVDLHISAFMRLNRYYESKPHFTIARLRTFVNLGVHKDQENGFF